MALDIKRLAPADVIILPLANVYSRASYVSSSIDVEKIIGVVIKCKLQGLTEFEDVRPEILAEFPEISELNYCKRSLFSDEGFCTCDACVEFFNIDTLLESLVEEIDWGLNISDSAKAAITERALKDHCWQMEVKIIGPGEIGIWT